ncbi:TrmB family transcriptional regulator [Halobacteriales archaeon QH_10_67_13]|nr:MAG: TrmB family transcriptional regulator [Halobacteriales archaeon QH_10_67_13]
MDPLDELGLSGYERRAYRTLLQTGNAPAATIAERSDVPEGRIYDALNGLVTKGLATARSDTPRRYAPVDPAAAADALLERRLGELAEAEREYRRLAARARSALAPTPPAEAGAWLAPLGSDDATLLARESSSLAEDRFAMAVGPPYSDAPLTAYRSEVEAFVEGLPAETTVDLLLESTAADALAEYVDPLAASEAEVGLRRSEAIDVSFTVIDGTAAYVELPRPFAAGDRLGFFKVRDERIATGLERRFDDRWADATPIDA